jgi:ribosomal protein S18 acetylase RimI-like enzyme
LHIRRLEAADAREYWETRNIGLREFPDAFTTTYEEGLATSPERLAARFGGAGSDDFVLGAFTEQGALAGCVGFQREPRLKNRHKGTLIGMYVLPDFRRQQVGRLLLGRLIDEVRTLKGMERMNLTVTHTNGGARTLYLRAGFLTFGLEQDALKAGDRYYDKEHMVLVL